MRKMSEFVMALKKSRPTLVVEHDLGDDLAATKRASASARPVSWAGRHCDRRTSAETRRAAEHLEPVGVVRLELVDDEVFIADRASLEHDEKEAQERKDPVLRKFPMNVQVQTGSFRIEALDWQEVPQSPRRRRGASRTTGTAYR